VLNDAKCYEKGSVEIIEKEKIFGEIIIGGVGRFFFRKIKRFYPLGLKSFLFRNFKEKISQIWPVGNKQKEFLNISPEAPPLRESS